MISYDERREVVARLRELLAIPWYERPWSRDAMQSLGKMVCAVPGEDIVERIADLIDRPTCHDVADFDRESFKCSRCGYRVLSIDGAPDAAKLVGIKGGVIDFGFCPNCGATVTEEGGCDVREL